GVQVRQSDKTQRALMHAQRTQRGIDLSMGFVSGDIAEKLNRAALHIDDATSKDYIAANSFVRSHVLNVLDSHWQFEAGMLDRQAFEVIVVGVTPICAIAAFRAAWMTLQRWQTAETVALIDRLLIANVPIIADPTEVAANWVATTKQLISASNAHRIPP